MKKILIFILAMVGVGAAVTAYANSLGPLGAGTGTDDNATGTVAWTNPGNITASDSNCATYTGSRTLNTASHYIDATNFGFSIPTGSTINGVYVEIQVGNPNGDNAGEETGVNLIKGGSIVGTNEASTTAIGFSTCTPSMGYFAHGSSTDLWGISLTPSDINASNFGVAIAYKLTAGGDHTTSLIMNYVRITIYYTPPNGTPTTLTISNGILSIKKGIITIQ